LAHVINLATQALIKGYSKAKYYSPVNPDEHMPDVDAFIRDEVGLIREIAVKVDSQSLISLYYLTFLQEQSSAKRKELFQTIQTEKLLERARSEGKEAIGQTKQLILDMPVRWSSTYGMLHRAEVLCEVRSNILGDF